MRALNRRQFLHLTTLTAGGLIIDRARAADHPRLRIGVTDWNLRHTGKPSAIAAAKELGFDGVEVSIGRAPDRLPLADPELQQQYLAQKQQHQFAIPSTCLDILHQNYLKSDPLARRWVAESIPISRKLGARSILLPFFGKGALTTRAEMDLVGDYLKEIAPEAEKAGIILGLENTISAEDNARILDRAQSKAVQVYYDVGNSERQGFDIYREIRWLGRERICQIHWKDRGQFLGNGGINFPRVLESIRAIGYQGWIVLETPAPSGNVPADLKKNLAYVRQLLA